MFYSNPDDYSSYYQVNDETEKRTRNKRFGDVINYTCSFLGISIPLVLLICGIILVTTENVDIGAIQIVYIFLGLVSLVSYCCQICSISFIQLIQLLRIFFDFGDGIERPKLIKRISQEITSIVGLFFTLFNIIGILMLLAGGIAFSGGNSSKNSIGISSIIIASLYFLNLITSCGILIYVSCFGFVVTSLSKESNLEGFEYGGNMGEHEFD
eukprot:gene12127-5618_t